MTTKYTKDGRKVAVLGKLNAEEFIVQEIFIREGQEIPGGENFTAKGLLDAPAESWKEKSLRELESRYDRDSKAYEAKQKQLHDRLRAAQAKAEYKIKALLAFAENAMPEQLETLIDYMAGRITHAVISCWRAPKIVAIDADDLYQTDNDYGRQVVEDIKLISLVGSSNGNLSFRLNKYRDGSGSSDEIRFFRSYADAVAFVQSEFNTQAEKWMADAKATDGRWIEEYQKIIGLVIPADVIAHRAALDTASRKAEIEKLRERLAELEG